MNRILYLAQKEFTQLFRDWRTLILTLVLPVAVLLLFGYAITLDIREIPLAVVDDDQSALSRDLVRAFAASGYFKARPVEQKEAQAFLERRQAKIVLVIPSDFEKSLGRGNPAALQLLVDGSDNNSSTIGLSYAQGLLQKYAFDQTLAALQTSGLFSAAGLPPIVLEPRVRFNSELDSTTFIVPGLVALIMMITVVVLSSLSIVKERELGTLETILVSPLTGGQFILGKLIPYFLLGFLDLFLILGAGKLLFGVPIRGSIFLLFLFSALFITGGLGMGLLISTVVETQRTAWMLSLLSTLLPSIILSGFIFPIRVMPKWLQLITYLVPVRYYLVIIRGITLKGADFGDLLPNVLALLVFAGAMLSLAVTRFRKRLA